MNNKKITFYRSVALYVKYQVERFLIRGPFYQVLFIGFLILLISLISGLLLRWVSPVDNNISTNSWWAFLRMSDPGYLGDDVGFSKRILSTILTLLGYVLFMGSLVAIMTQWLYRTMKLLEAGLTPIAIKGHISILSYTNRTPIIIDQLLSSKNRFKRFIRKAKNATKKIVILNPEVGHEISADLATHLSSDKELDRVIFRTGELMSVDDLGRINIEHSSVVILPSMIYGQPDLCNSDMRTIKSLLSIKNRAKEQAVVCPRAVVEILDHNNVDVAKSAYGTDIEVVSSRFLLSRMIAQNIQNPGLSYVISELISQGIGSEIYIRSFKSLIGKNWAQVRSAFDESIPIGVISSVVPCNCIINPPDDELISEEDQIVFISHDYETIKLNEKSLQKEIEVNKDLCSIRKNQSHKLKVLIMGWSKKAPFLVNELLSSPKKKYEIDIISKLETAKRDFDLRDNNEEQKSVINHIEADYTSTSDMRNIDFNSYDNVVFLSSDREEDGADADARSILGMLQLKAKLEDYPSTFIELAESENERIFDKKEAETFVSPMVMSYILSNVALRPELNKVFDHLFNSGGADIAFISPQSISLKGNVSFGEITKSASCHGVTGIGVMRKGTNEVYLNPMKSKVFTQIENFEVVIIG